MSGLCGTRAIKNAKHIRSVTPQVFPPVEPLDGFASILPFDVLNRFHRMTDEELRGYPHLLEAATILRGKPRTSGPRAERLGSIFEDAPFQGTLHFLKITFMVGTTSLALSDADLTTMLQYTTLALPAIAKYASQYGKNRLAVSSNILELTVNVPSGKYNDDMLQGWVKAVAETLIIQKIESSPANLCIVVFNPDGVINTDADSSMGVLGYHDAVFVPVISTFPPTLIPSPYCFVNVAGNGLTVQDKREQYAQILSHEIAEMTVDPLVSWTNPEVCDPCAGNCRNEWRSFFVVKSPEGSLRYLRSSKGFPPLPFRFDFFTAAVAEPRNVDDCPAPGSGCDYGPDVRAGISELLFYEQADGYGELYSVDAAAHLSLQTTHPDWRTSWSLIVPGTYTSKPPGSPLDLLFYDRSAGVGEFYQTGSLGDMNQISVSTGWRTSWSMIIPGKFSDSPYTDLLFYDPSTGTGEFYHTGGGLSPLFATDTGWRTSWSIIERL